VGKGLYGVDIKEVNGEYVVVEVNDNPSIYAGYEDSVDKDIYKKIIGYLSQ
jgi:glutathione synthase/RimK-type ligase-like ATP-grasp enzyme